MGDGLMTAEEAVWTRLLALSGVTALVSTRVSVGKLPQGPTYPCVRVSLVSHTPDAYHLRGQAGLVEDVIQVDAFAHEASGVDPYATASDLAEAINGDGAGSGLSGWAGSIGSPACVVVSCQREARRQQYDPEELQVVGISQDYRVTYRA
jgi:hypothetical protein